jgi:16S rRNA (uracil1498-N3)-methyltransferase
VNLLLLEPHELGPAGEARLGGRRARHVREVLGCTVGDRIAVGLVGGLAGQAEVLSLEGDALVLRATLDRPPPPPSPVSLLLALPRPKILRKVLQAVAAMGVKRVVLLGSWRVEKSYWGSPVLAPEALRQELLLGLEQGRDTVLPEVALHRFFKPFVEDQLEATFPGARRLADPRAVAWLEATPAPGGGLTVAVGPEGGWTGYEAAELERRGFLPCSLGPRPLRVDQAVPFLVGQAELWLRASVRPGPGSPPAP